MPTYVPFRRVSYCTSCGQPVLADASFCRACGAPVRPPTTPPAPASPPAPAAFPPTAATRPQAAAKAQRPSGVTLVGIGILVAAGLAAIGVLGILFAIFVVGSFGAAMDGWFGMAWMGSIAAAAMLFGAVVLAGLVAFLVATGLGVLNGRSWAWAAALVVAGLGVLAGVSTIAEGDLSGVLPGAAGGVTLWYFFQPEAKAWFGRA